MWFSNRIDTYLAVRKQKITRGRKEDLYYPCSENKGTDQRLCFRIIMLNDCFLMMRPICSIQHTVVMSLFLLLFLQNGRVIE